MEGRQARWEHSMNQGPEAGPGHHELVDRRAEWSGWGKEHVMKERSYSAVGTLS